MVGIETYTDEQKLFILNSKDAGMDNATIVELCQQKWKKSTAWTTNGIKYVWNKYKYAPGWVDRVIPPEGGVSTASLQPSPTPLTRTPAQRPSQPYRQPAQQPSLSIDPAIMQNLYHVSFPFSIAM